MNSDKPQFDKITKQLNNIFDDIDDYLFAELKAIIDYRSSSCVLEFKVKYINGDEKWHPIDLIKDEDPVPLQTTSSQMTWVL